MVDRSRVETIEIVSPIKSRDFNVERTFTRHGRHGIIHRMRADGSWEVVYDEEAEVINEEDLLLDLESSISEQWDEQDELSYDDDSEEEQSPRH